MLDLLIFFTFFYGKSFSSPFLLLKPLDVVWLKKTSSSVMHFQIFAFSQLPPSFLISPSRRRYCCSRFRLSRRQQYHSTLASSSSFIEWAVSFEPCSSSKRKRRAKMTVFPCSFSYCNCYKQFRWKSRCSRSLPIANQALNVKNGG